MILWAPDFGYIDDPIVTEYYLFLSFIHTSQLFWYGNCSGYVFKSSILGTESFLVPETLFVAMRRKGEIRNMKLA